MIGAVSASDLKDNNINDLSDNDAVIMDHDGVEKEMVIYEGVIDENVIDSTNNKEIYVNDTGDDSNTGSINSPYSSIGKAVAEVNSSSNTIIYLSKGTFGKDNDTNFQFTNRVNTYFDNCNVTFIGAGTDKTFIDGQSAFKFMTITRITPNLVFKDITFVNFKGSGSSTFSLSNAGSLTIDNCIFKDCYSTNNRDTISASSSGEIKITNSQFINLNGGAIKVECVRDSSKNFYLENNIFENITNSQNQGIAVHSTNSKANIRNNKFINITCINQNQGTLHVDFNDYSSAPEDKYIININNNSFIDCNSLSSYYAPVIISSYDENITFENNTFSNSTNVNGYNIFLTTGFIFSLKADIDIAKINVGNNEIKNGVENLPLKITDDNGNTVYINDGISFNIISDNNNYTPSFNQQTLKLTFYNVPESGIYNVTVSYNRNVNTQEYLSTTDVLATMIINASTEPAEFWVSPKGSDANNGSQSNPFKTIQHAMDVGFDKSFNVVLHLAEGTYSGDDNVNLTISNKGSLKIIGEKYNETIIDGEGSNWFMSVSTCQVDAENLKFINGYNSNHLISGSSLYLKDCIVDNNVVTSRNSYVISSSTFNNLVYTNNTGTIYYNSENAITNSYFANNKNIYTDMGILYIYYHAPTISDCKFINNTATGSVGAVYFTSGSISKNNYYYGNKAKNYGVFSGSTDVVFINDTFENNHADVNYGVGSFYYNNIGSSLTNCKFVNNSAETGGVGYISVESSFKDCSFVNNSAINGGVFILEAVQHGLGTTYNETIKLNNVTFENNKADNGNDIYLKPRSSSPYYTYTYPIELTISYNNVTVKSLKDNLTAHVYGPNGIVVGGPNLEFVLNNVYIGASPIINSYVVLEYAGFTNGKATVSGNIIHPSVLNIINNVTLNVNVPGALDHIDFWVSNSGSDEKGSGSENNPFKTIQFAVDKAFENCRDTTIYLKDEIYSGEGNTNLTLSSAGNLRIIGKGIGKTFITGDNANYFAHVEIGQNVVLISDLTIINMTPDNRFDLPIGSTSPSGIHSIIKSGSFSPIKVENGATLHLNNVNITGCHGGVAIIDGFGNILIDNSTLYENGVATGIIKCKDLVINNSIIDKHLVGGYPISANNIIINNSKIIDVFNIIRNGFYLISGSGTGSGVGSGTANSTTIENTYILTNNWENPLNMLNITEDYDTQICPASCIASVNIYVANSIFKNEFDLVYLWQSTTDYSYHNIFASSNMINVHDSSFEGYKFLIYSRSNMNGGEYIFDGCSLNNISKFAIFMISRNFNVSLSNSVILSFDAQITSNAAMNNNFVFNNNYWGNNSQPDLKNSVATFTIPDPETWIILVSEGDEPVFKLTDGENRTSYEGNLPVKISYIDDENGDVIPVVNIAGTGYKFSVDENGSVVLNTTAPIKNIVPKVPVDETVLALNVTTLVNETSKFTATFTNKWGDPLKDTNVSFIIGDTIINRTTDENGTASFDINFALGKYTVTITNPVTDQSIFKTIAVTTLETTFASDVNATFNDGSKFTANFTNEFGQALANTKVTFKLGSETINATTDAKGSASFTINFNAGTYNVTVINPVTGQSIEKTVIVAPLTTKLIASPVTTTYNINKDLVITLTDVNGNALANSNVVITLNGKENNVKTDKNGQAKLTVSLAAGQYTATATFKGDSNYVKSTTTAQVVVKKAAPKLTAKKATFKAKTKTKKYSVILKDNKNNAISKVKVTLKVKGKTYTATTNAKGKATFKITKLTKKGKYAAKVTFKGNGNFNSVAKTVKYIVVKK